MSKSFSIVGVSRLSANEPFKLRVANGKVDVRKRVLERNGHVGIELFELPNAMSKEDAQKWLAGAHPKIAASVEADAGKPTKEVKLPKSKAVAAKDPVEA